MPENNIQRENLELKARLQAMGGILRLSHDAVLQPDLKSLAVHIVNNSRPLVQYVRACLVAADGAAPRILAEMSQVEVNSHSEYANNIRLIASVLKIEAPQEISAADIDRLAPSEAARRAFQAVLGERRRLYVVPLSSPRIPGSKAHPYLWIMEFNGAVPPHVKTSTGLLADMSTAARCGASPPAAEGRGSESGCCVPGTSCSACCCCSSLRCSRSAWTTTSRRNSC